MSSIEVDLDPVPRILSKDPNFHRLSRFATDGHVLRSRIVLVMARWFHSFLGIALALSVFLGVGCTVPDTGSSATAAEPNDGPTPRPASEVDSSGSVFDDQPSGFGVFPAFVPPIGLGGGTQECELGNDPYSTCV
jgi:hypothetical protein